MDSLQNVTILNEKPNILNYENGSFIFRLEFETTQFDFVRLDILVEKDEEYFAWTNMTLSLFNYNKESRLFEFSWSTLNYFRYIFEHKSFE